MVVMMCSVFLSIPASIRVATHYSWDATKLHFSPNTQHAYATSSSKLGTIGQSGTVLILERAQKMNYTDFAGAQRVKEHSTKSGADKLRLGRNWGGNVPGRGRRHP